MPLLSERSRLHRYVPWEQRFWPRIDRSGGLDSCWEWQGCRDTDGYGKIKVEGKDMRTHRLMSSLAHGPIPDGVDICHACDNPPCCNPLHLFAGSNRENVRDAIRKGRRAPAPALRGEEHPNAKLTWADVRKIREERARGGVTFAELGRRYGVSRDHIHHIVSGQIWREDANVPHCA